MSRITRYAALFLFLSLNAVAAPANDASGPWQALTRLDVEAMYQALLNNHPGALPEMADQDFRDRLEKAHQNALARVAAVRGPAGYSATLHEFANRMGDRHISVRDGFQPLNSTRWAGLVSAFRGGDWVIATNNKSEWPVDYNGWKIVSCDGKDVNELARERLVFNSDVSSDVGLTLVSGALLLDDGNPFLLPPKQCRLTHDGKTADVVLRWRPANAGTQRFFRPATGSPGYGIKSVGKGLWISLQSFTAPAAAVARDAKARANELRQAPFVVIDLRGNGGGNSALAGDVIGSVYGDGYGDVIRSKTMGCGASYRVSAGNLERVDTLIANARETDDRRAAARFDTLAQHMRAAQREGRTTTDVICRDGQNPAAPPTHHGKVFVVTDAACFSSCLLTVDALKKLGAIQIGAATGAHNRYMESATDVLPSGLATMSYVIGIAQEWRSLGPFTPEIPFRGDIADNAAVEAWALKAIGE